MLYSAYIFMFAGTWNYVPEPRTWNYVVEQVCCKFVVGTCVCMMASVNCVITWDVNL